MPDDPPITTQGVSSLLEAVVANQRAITSLLEARDTTGGDAKPTPATTDASDATVPPVPPQPNDARPQSNSNHAPPRVEHYDFMRSEKTVSIYLSKNRLEPYDRDIGYQIDELKDMFLTPSMDEPSRWMSLDAYTRQSNRIEEEMEEFIDQYRREHTTWHNAGGQAEIFCYKGVTEWEGRDARAARKHERERLEQHPAIGGKCPVLKE